MRRWAMMLGWTLALSSSCAARSCNADEIQDFAGTWMCVESHLNGQRVDSYVGAWAIFDGDTMTWIFPRPDGEDLRQTCKFEIDATQDPKHFDWYAIDRPDRRMLRLYRLKDGMLLWSTNISSENRPSGFAEGKWQFRCRRLSPTTSP